MAENKDIAKIKLTNVRLSFPQLYTAKAIEDGKEPKFSANFIFDNEKDAEQLDAIDRLIDRIALDFFKKKVTLKYRPLRDGNDDAVAEKDGYGDGTSYLVASSKNRPAVVDRNPEISIAEADGKIYAGCRVNAIVRFYAYDHKVGGKGVSAELKCVQFVADDESLGGGRVNPEEEFDNMENQDASTPSRGSSSTRSTRSGRGNAPVSTNVEDF